MKDGKSPTTTREQYTRSQVNKTDILWFSKTTLPPDEIKKIADFFKNPPAEGTKEEGEDGVQSWWSNVINKLENSKLFGRKIKVEK